MKTKLVDEVQIYSTGVCCCSVCAPKSMSAAAVVAAVNRISPTGIESSWSKSKDQTFQTGEPNPCPCKDEQDRRHWLLNC